MIWLGLTNRLTAAVAPALETIAEVSARLIVNKAAMKLRSEALKALVARFAAVMDKAP
jgi:ATP phosphoribosyltransferase